MKLATLFALGAALRSSLASGITIMVPEQWKDSATVRGKKTSDGDIETMSRATHDINSQGFCPDPARLQLDLYRECETRYYGITSRINFAEPTKDPRPINITVGTDFHECTFDVGNPDLPVYWLVDWGFASAGDGWKIVCKKGPIPE